MTPAQKQAVERLQAFVASRPRAIALTPVQNDVRTLLVLLDEQREALRPFAGAAAHLDGIEVRHWRRAAALTEEPS